jgi:signal peptide peptidase SppA
VSERLILPAFPRVTDYAGLWCVEETAAAAMIRRAQATDWAAHLEANADPRPRAAVQLLSAGGGRSVAVVRLDGTLMKAASSFGGTSTVQARRDIRAAVADPDVAAILLAIDSPGGTVSGTDDLAADVKAANKEKPVWAFVSDLCASAAYWVASQCEAIYANSDTAWVGSIGTFLALTDDSKAAADAGVEAVVFRTGPLKGSGAAAGDPITEDMRTHFQGLVEKSQATFDAAVRKGRDLTDAQLAAVRTGGVFTAAEATDRKLIDGVQSLDKTVSALIRAANARARSQPSGRQSAVNPNGAPMPKPTATEDVIELTEAQAGDRKPDGFATVADTRAAVSAELKRMNAIHRLCRNHPDIADKATDEGWSLERTENAVLRADLPKPPAPGNPHGGRFSDVEGHARTAALCLSLGIKEEIAAKGIPDGMEEEVMNLAMSGDLRGYSLHALMADVIRAAGKSHSGNRKTDSFARAALEADRDLKLQASGSGFTSVSLSGILANVANKALLNAYTAVNTVWRMIAAVRSHSDFKTVTRYRLDSTGALKKVGPDGEIKHVGLDNASYTNKLDTYAAMLALTRQMMINDDLGAFTSLPAFMGRMAALRIEELVFALILANTGSFFAAGNSNLLSGGASALTDAGTALDTAETSFLNMVDSNGKPVLTTPSILLVPTALKAVATRLYTGGALISGDTTLTRVANNSFVGKYAPVVSPYLSNTALRDQDGVAFSGQSSTAHYLFADPNDRAAIGVAFLNGQEQPTIESAETDFNTLGQQWRIFHDFGAGFEDPTAAVKSAGA